MATLPVPSEVVQCMEDMIQRLEATPMAKISTTPDIVEMLPPKRAEEEVVPPEVKRFRELWAARCSERSNASVPSTKRIKPRYRFENGKLIALEN